MENGKTIEQILRAFLDSDGKLKQLPSKRKMKIYASYYLATKLEKGKRYTESEINAAIGQLHTFGDHSTLRRQLCDDGYLNREKDGSAYWLSDPLPDPEELIKAII
jgi:hypothetical protein